MPTAGARFTHITGWTRRSGCQLPLKVDHRKLLNFLVCLPSQRLPTRWLFVSIYHDRSESILISRSSMSTLFGPCNKSSSPVLSLFCSRSWGLGWLQSVERLLGPSPGIPGFWNSSPAILIRLVYCLVPVLEEGSIRNLS